MSEKYRVHIRKDSIEIEVESTNREYVDEKIEVLTNNFLKPSRKVGDSPINTEGKIVTSVAGSKGMSLPEFLRTVKPKSGTDYAVTIGYYIEKFQDKDSFGVNEIKNGFLQAKFQHSNPSDTIAKAKTIGKIMGGPEKGTYVLTQTGEQWVEDRLNTNRVKD